MVALLSSPDPLDHFCGGTVIASRYVVTAAHCVQDKAEFQIFVRVGEHDLRTAGEAEVERTVRVAHILLHANYTLRLGWDSNDIALLELAEELDLATHTPACLASPGHQAAGNTATVSGWGTLEFGGDKAHTLQEVEVPVLSHEECSNNMVVTITKDMLCAGATDKDACQVWLCRFAK